MSLSDELSREELAFINHDLARELVVDGRQLSDKLGMAEFLGWLNGGVGPLSGFFNTELREKELVSKGFSAEDAAQKVKEDQRNMMLMETAMGITGGMGKGGSKATGPKVPPKLEPFKNPAQGPVIPQGWVSRPGRTEGSTIYFPPGTDPSKPGSTYIRVMPPGSTPVPGLENGYWISVKSGQPINPATGGTGTRGETHVPLPPNTMPPKR